MDKVVQKDRLKFKKFLKLHNFGFRKNTYFLCKNKITNILYLAVTTLTNDVVFLKSSNLDNELDQIKEIFSDYNFDDDTARGFDMFPGFDKKIYGYCDSHNIILGSSCQVVRF